MLIPIVLSVRMVGERWGDAVLNASHLQCHASLYCYDSPRYWLYKVGSWRLNELNPRNVRSERQRTPAEKNPYGPRSQHQQAYTWGDRGKKQTGRTSQNLKQQQAYAQGEDLKHQQAYAQGEEEKGEPQAPAGVR